VAVLAAGRTLERNSIGEAQNTAVITLLVTPDDAQRLTLASSQGRIQLSLRNPLDTKQDEVPAAVSRGLFHGLPAAPVVRTAVHHIENHMDTTPKPPIPSDMKIEVYQGDKKQDYKFPEEGSGNN
jgi:pilus assembly protein CpaB